MRKLILAFCAVFYSQFAFVQNLNPSLLTTSGSNRSASTYEIGWSIGEIVTNTHQSNNYVLTQGFHQNSYEFTLINDPAKNININVYPNPTKDFLNLDLPLQHKSYKNIDFKLFDEKGKIIQSSKLNNSVNKIRLHDYPDGVYYLHFTNREKLIKSYKIIKN